MRSGLPPAIQADVACVNAAAQPDVTIANSEPVISASRAPTASISSSMTTKRRDASTIAVRTSGRTIEPPNLVIGPVALMTDRVPIDS